MKNFLIQFISFTVIVVFFLGCESENKGTKKNTSQEKSSLSYKEKMTKGPTDAMAVYIALIDKDVSQSKVKSLCKEIVKKKGASNIRIFIYDDIKYTPSSLPVPENLDAHWLYLYAYNKSTGLDKLEKMK